MQLTPHFHCIIPDGVFIEDKETGKVSFFPLPAPTDDEVDGLLLALMKRLHALLTKRGFLGDEAQDTSGPDALAKLQQEGALGQRHLSLAGTESARTPKAKQKKTDFKDE